LVNLPDRAFESVAQRNAEQGACEIFAASFYNINEFVGADFDEGARHLAPFVQLLVVIVVQNPEPGREVRKNPDDFPRPRNILYLTLNAVAFDKLDNLGQIRELFALGLELLAIHRIALGQIFLQNAGRPNAERRRVFGIHAIYDRQNHVEVIEFYIDGNRPAKSPFHDVCKFCTCRDFRQLPVFVHIFYMLCYDSSVHAENRRDLRLRQPNGFILELYLDAVAAVRTPINNYVVVFHLHLLRYFPLCPEMLSSPMVITPLQTYPSEATSARTFSNKSPDDS